MNPLPPLLQTPSGPAPAKPTEPLPAFDLLAYSSGGALLVATQLYSKSHPHLAAEVSANIIGPRFRARPFEHGVTITRLVPSIAPAPFGFVDPTNYGLEPNYLFGIESHVKHHVPSLGRATLPTSEMLHTLPDNDPRVRYAKHEQRAREQRRELDTLTRNLPLEDLLDLYDLSRHPEAGKIFFNPEDIEAQIRASGISRAGGIEEFGRAVAARRAVQSVPALLGPAGTSALIRSPRPAPAPVPAPQAPGRADLPAVFSEPFRPRGTINVRDESLFGTPFGGGRLAPPTNTQQQEAMRRAPELLAELVTERSDP